MMVVRGWRPGRRCRRVAPEPERLGEFAEVIRHASNPVLIYGAAIARGDGWKQAVELAEALNAPVWAAPASERAPFPKITRCTWAGCRLRWAR